jgi:lysophospholipase L1-like esterase
MTPLVCGPGSYCADAGIPAVVVWACGTNDAANASDTTASISAVVSRLDQLISQWRSQYPQVVHVIWSPPPGASTDAAFDHDYHGTVLADQYYYEQRQRALSRALISYYGGREDEGIYISATATGVDTDTDYPIDNALHPTSTGYTHLADSMRAAIAAALGY